MRKFCRESVRVPVTWAMLPARSAWRGDVGVDGIGGRLALLLGERWFAASRSEARSLLESCSERSVSTFAALILFSTETSVLRSGVARKRIVFEIADLRFEMSGRCRGWRRWWPWR